VIANARKLREERADHTEAEIARLRQGIGAVREIRSNLHA
jgi:hypothetical protein